MQQDPQNGQQSQPPQSPASPPNAPSGFADGMPPIPTSRGSFSEMMQRRLVVPMWAAVVTGVVLLCMLCGLMSTALSHGGNSSTTGQTGGSTTQATTAPKATNTPKPTATPTHVPKWTTVQTFTGNGVKKTGTFSVPNDWKIVWSCDPSSFYGGQYNVIVSVYDSSGNPVDYATVNTICKSGNTGDSTEEHQGGNVYLDVNSEGSWKIQVQVLK
jgi:hypothetical protein